MQNTADRPGPLLSILSDEELARFGEIAADQAALELEGWQWQVALLAGAAMATVWSAVKWGLAEIEALGVKDVGFGSGVVLGLGSAVALGYSPYRRVRNWTLWTRHGRSVRYEQERRRSALQRG
jgi:hypothetical protein